MTIPGFTSTGSKRPDSLFGAAAPERLRMVRAQGCTVWDEEGKEYLDLVMALGAVGLGYAHPRVVEAATQAMRDGGVGPLAPVAEGALAERIADVIEGAEATRFLKTGAEAVAAAVRIARVYTGRDRIITCGYHGWLDWCQEGLGVPPSVAELRREIPFNNVAALEATLTEFGPVAAVVLEPVVDGPPDPVWLKAARGACTASDALLIFDEIKTAFRVSLGGGAARYKVLPDLMVLGKALGNGFPIAAVCGPAEIMSAATSTWISSTLATEFVSLAAALAVIEVFERENVIGHLERVGGELMRGLESLADGYPALCSGVAGIPQMCYLQWRTPELSAAVARAAAKSGVLLKRTAYNFVSLAHTDQVVGEIIDRLDRVMTGIAAC
ncbi:MAG: aminotransferase class III-fold pyridoxal phosphate-dependent enzyme [Gemmatimonadales bacterium]